MRPVVNQQLLDAIHCSDEISGLTHNAYRYPARSSPYFVRAVIETFTQPGQLVFDPFMGGGTTLIEASVLGRKAVGCDINSLAVFVSKAKTLLMSNRDLAVVNAWARTLVSASTIRQRIEVGSDWIDLGYLKHLDKRETWRMRKMIAIALESLRYLRSDDQRILARLIILRTAQWALDNRRTIPTVHEFRKMLQTTASEATKSSKEYSKAASAVLRTYGSQGANRPVCLHRTVIGIEHDPQVRSLNPPRLILTSPPYPGVHILYHRWQVQGRRESPAPFWITNSLDGEGASYYTFGDRNNQDLKTYFSNAEVAFRSIAQISDAKTIIVQMIAFSDPAWQLPEYLRAMERAGLREIAFDSSTSAKCRIWRSVPNRRWYASWRRGIPSSQEVVLLHQLA